MNRLARNIGVALIVIGMGLLAVWAVRPLRVIWPWVMGLPLLIRIGLIAAAGGLIVLLSSLIVERLGESKADKELLDDPRDLDPT